MFDFYTFDPVDGSPTVSLCSDTCELVSCLNGEDDDGDGSADALDPDCYDCPSCALDAFENGFDPEADGYTVFNPLRTEGNAQCFLASERSVFRKLWAYLVAADIANCDDGNAGKYWCVNHGEPLQDKCTNQGVCYGTVTELCCEAHWEVAYGQIPDKGLSCGDVYQVESTCNIPTGDNKDCTRGWDCVSGVCKALDGTVITSRNGLGHDRKNPEVGLIGKCEACANDNECVISGLTAGGDADAVCTAGVCSNSVPDSVMCTRCRADERGGSMACPPEYLGPGDFRGKIVTGTDLDGYEDEVDEDGKVTAHAYNLCRAECGGGGGFTFGGGGTTGSPFGPTSWVCQPMPCAGNPGMARGFCVPTQGAGATVQQCNASCPSTCIPMSGFGISGGGTNGGTTGTTGGSGTTGGTTGTTGGTSGGSAGSRASGGGGTTGTTGGTTGTTGTAGTTGGTTGGSAGSAASGGGTTGGTTGATGGTTGGSAGSLASGASQNSSGRLSSGASQNSSGRLSSGASQNSSGRLSSGASQNSSGRLSSGASQNSSGRLSSGASQNSSGRLSSGASQNSSGRLSSGASQNSSGRLSSGASQNSSGRLSSGASQNSSGRLSSGASQNSSGRLSSGMSVSSRRLSSGTSVSSQRLYSAMSVNSRRLSSGMSVSSRRLSSGASSVGVCRGDECRLGGIDFCDKFNAVCITTVDLPCIRCIPLPSSASSASSLSSFSQGSSALSEAVSSRTYSASLECGNGVMDWGEACDDGNDIDDDSCTNDCRKATDILCSGNRECVSGRCLDGKCTWCQTDEECSYGSCIGAICIDVLAGTQVSEKTPVCGDGNLDDGEGCDDGNRIAGDGCSEICAEERLAATAILPGAIVELPFLPGSVRPGSGVIGGMSGVGVPPGATVPQTGPGLVAVAAAGAAGGLAWIRRRRR